MKFILLIEPNIIFPKQILGNINIALGFTKYIEEGTILHGPVVGFETNFIPSDYIWEIKMGYFIDYVHFLGLSFRLNSIMYNNNINQWDIRIQPEIGITMVGVLGITYGYHIITNRKQGNW